MKKEESRFVPDTLFEGMTSVRAVLGAMDQKISDRRITRILVDETKVKSRAKELGWLRFKAGEYGFEIVTVSPDEIYSMTTGNTHGGILAECTARTIPALTAQSIRPDGFYVMIEGIEDPYNFGYAIRSLYACGADGIVLDVKCGSGAFMKDLESAEKLAIAMADMGRHVGRKVTAVISGMDQPLGMYIGNSLEVMEAMEVLKDNVGGDLLEVSLTLGANMLLLAGRVKTEEEGKALLLENIKNGKGLEKFREMLAQQGGDVNIIDNYDLLPLSSVKMEVKADRSGYITRMDTAMIGRASQETGAGRMFKGQPLDFGAGIIMKKRTGDAIATGETLAVVYSESKEKCDSAADFLKKAITIEDTMAAEQPPLIWKIIRQED